MNNSKTETVKSLMQPRRNSLGFFKSPQKTRVVVAMSGGVDSSVVAAKLKEENYDVVGITLQLYNHGEKIGKKGTCCAGVDIRDARRISEKLKFPHYVLNYESNFRESVINEFANSYLAGYTPIPCIRCNERVKFKDLLKMAIDLNADCMATGHYVRRLQGKNGMEMHVAVSHVKDQSYFLFSTTREQLDFLRFPLGELKSKTETRRLAEKFGLQVADKPDSQDICFVPNGSYSDLIRKLRPESDSPGLIVNRNGKRLGTHKGIINYTVGQRRGLGVGGGEPLFVLKVDAAKNQVVVGPRNALCKKEISLNNINWLGDGVFINPPKKKWEVEVKVRSTKPPRRASIFPTSETEAKVTFFEPDEGISPGQACVFYEKNSSRVLGGGWITKG